jgi:hypothetical protein
MAEINASIPLGVTAPQQQDPINTVAKAYELKDMILKDKQQEQQLKTQSELKSIFSDPTTDTSTPEGQQKLIKRVAAVDPAQALQLQKDYSTVDLQKAQTSKALASIASEKFDQIKKASDLTNSAFSYLDNLAQGPQGKDKVFMNQAFQQQVQHLKDQGVITPEMAKQIPQQYDANWVHATSMQDKDHANLINQEAERREKAFKDNADIRQGQQRIGIEAENASTNRARLGYEENQPKTELGKIEADYKAGKISTSEYTDAVAKQRGTGGQAGQTQQRYNQNLINAAEDGSQTIDALGNMKFNTGRFFGNKESEGGLFESSGKEWLAQSLSSDAATQVNQTMSEFKRVIAAAQAGGGRVSEGAVKALNAIDIKPGMSVKDTQYAVSIGASTVANALDSVDTSKMSPEQAAKINKQKAYYDKIPKPAELQQRWHQGESDTGTMVPSKEGGKSGGEDYSSFWSQ